MPHFTVAMIPLDINVPTGDQTVECSSCGPLIVASQEEATAYGLAHLKEHGVDIGSSVTEPDSPTR